MIHEILQNGRKSLHHNYSPGIRDETIVAAFFRPPFERWTLIFRNKMMIHKLNLQTWQWQYSFIRHNCHCWTFGIFGWIIDNTWDKDSADIYLKLKYIFYIIFYWTSLLLLKLIKCVWIKTLAKNPQIWDLQQILLSIGWFWQILTREMEIEKYK